MFEIVGFKRVEFTSKKSGQTVKGIKYFVTEEGVRDVEGVICDSFFLSDAKLRENGVTPNIGDSVDIVYNKYGSISRVDVI